MKDNLLTPNKFSRPQTPIKPVKALVIHWTANPGQGEIGVRNYFESRKNGTLGYGSAHFVIGINGDALRMIPENEVAYHVGSSQIDPASGKIYTDMARAKFGEFAIDHIHKSPNSVCLGIELCVIDAKGAMSIATVSAAIELSAEICKKHNLNPMTDILLHKEVVGWKNCHKWFIDNPEEWKKFKESVRSKL